MLSLGNHDYHIRRKRGCSCPPRSLWFYYAFSYYLSRTFMRKTIMSTAKRTRPFPTHAVVWTGPLSFIQQHSRNWFFDNVLYVYNAFKILWSPQPLTLSPTSVTCLPILQASFQHSFPSVLRPSEFNQDYLCDHGFGNICWNLVGSWVDTQMKTITAPSPESITRKQFTREG